MVTPVLFRASGARRRCLAASIACLLATSATYSQDFTDDDWISQNPAWPGTLGVVWTSAADSSGNIYAGGEFAYAGTVQAKNIAKWNGSEWSPLGTGTDGRVNAVVVSSDNVYVGGTFKTAGGITVNGIARWDGTNWFALGSGIAGANSRVDCLAVIGSALFAGGNFTRAGGVAATNIARWSGASWSSVGSGVAAEWEPVYTLASAGTTLYAGGGFTKIGGVVANGIAKWNGTTWSALGLGVANGRAVRALAVTGATVYAGGQFTTAGGVAANYAAKWNGSTWSSLGSGMSDSVSALVLEQGNLYAGGRFTSAGGTPVNYFAKWDGTAWSAPPGYSSYVVSLSVAGTQIYGSGYGVPMQTIATGLARFDGTNWFQLGQWKSGFLASIPEALAADSETDRVFASGVFASSPPPKTSRLAEWNGRHWQHLDTWVDGNVTRLSCKGGNLYAAVSLSQNSNYLGCWNGSTWTQLGSEFDREIYGIASVGSRVYAAGWFVHAGTNVVNRVAVWDGAQWAGLAGGLNSSAGAMATDGTNLYVGGTFTTAGGVSASCIAVWDGTQWSALGSGMSGAVPPAYEPWISALALNDGTLYAGGHFLYAGGALVNHVAKWDGTAWSPLGSGIYLPANPDRVPRVSALVNVGANLYAAGTFSSAGGVPANFIARWDGTSWSALGSGVDGYIYGLAADQKGHLFVCGDFHHAGGKISHYIARANIGPCAGYLGLPVYSPTTGVSVEFLDGKLGQTYRLQSSSTLQREHWADLTNFTYTGPFIIKDPEAASAERKFYRAVSP